MRFSKSLVIRSKASEHRLCRLGIQRKPVTRLKRMKTGGVQKQWSNNIDRNHQKVAYSIVLRVLICVGSETNDNGKVWTKKPRKTQVWTDAFTSSPVFNLTQHWSRRISWICLTGEAIDQNSESSIGEIWMTLDHSEWLLWSTFCSLHVFCLNGHICTPKV